MFIRPISYLTQCFSWLLLLLKWYSMKILFNSFEEIYLLSTYIGFKNSISLIFRLLFNNRNNSKPINNIPTYLCRLWMVFRAWIQYDIVFFLILYEIMSDNIDRIVRLMGHIAYYYFINVVQNEIIESFTNFKFA